MMDLLQNEVKIEIAGQISICSLQKDVMKLTAAV
jgi:hypothetical protein